MLGSRDIQLSRGECWDLEISYQEGSVGIGDPVIKRGVLGSGDPVIKRGVLGSGDPVIMRGVLGS